MDGEDLMQARKAGRLGPRLCAAQRCRALLMYGKYTVQYDGAAGS